MGDKQVAEYVKSLNVVLGIARGAGVPERTRRGRSNIIPEGVVAEYPTVIVVFDEHIKLHGYSRDFPRGNRSAVGTSVKHTIDLALGYNRSIGVIWAVYTENEATGVQVAFVSGKSNLPIVVYGASLRIVPATETIPSYKAPVSLRLMNVSSEATSSEIDPILHRELILPGRSFLGDWRQHGPIHTVQELFSQLPGSGLHL